MPDASSADPPRVARLDELEGNMQTAQDSLQITEERIRIMQDAGERVVVEEDVTAALQHASRSTSQNQSFRSDRFILCRMLSVRVARNALH